jgi:hypothetical protein
MTINYDFILEAMKYSNSSLESSEHCKHGFLLQYVLSKDQIKNFFGDFGSYVHGVLEKYFKHELAEFELPKYYEEHYREEVTAQLPPYPPNMGETYYNDGLNSFLNIDFDLDKYDIISIEEYMNFEYNGINLVIKPDVILRDKDTGEYILLDIKTHKLKGNKTDNKSIEGYMRQAQLYTYGIWQVKNIQISKIMIWYFRNQQITETAVDPLKIMETMDWVDNAVKEIKQEEKWEANLSKSNAFWCEHICSVSLACQPRLSQQKEK